MTLKMPLLLPAFNEKKRKKKSEKSELKGRQDSEFKNKITEVKITE